MWWRVEGEEGWAWSISVSRPEMDGNNAPGHLMQFRQMWPREYTVALSPAAVQQQTGHDWAAYIKSIKLGKKLKRVSNHHLFRFSDCEEELDGLSQDWVGVAKYRTELITRKQDLEILYVQKHAFWFDTTDRSMYFGIFQF